MDNKRDGLQGARTRSGRVRSCACQVRTAERRRCCYCRSQNLNHLDSKTHHCRTFLKKFDKTYLFRKTSESKNGASTSVSTVVKVRPVATIPSVKSATSKNTAYAGKS